MNITSAALELDSIRNDRSGDTPALLARTDAVGRWLATQKSSKKVTKLLTEAHQLSDRLQGGSGKSGVTLVIQ